MAKKQMTHLDEQGAARMVDVGGKAVTERVAVAEGELRMSAETRLLLFSGKSRKGDALAAARIAGIMAAKNTASLIPLCHPLALSSIDIDIEEVARPSAARVRATVKLAGKTGVEMEALTAVSVALLTLYDMLKSVQRDMRIERVRLRHKSGGRSGTINQ